MVTVNDFFCGAGGMGLGFKQAGFTINASWDFNPHAVKSYKENVEEHVLQSNILDMTEEDVPDADVWAFGFPCQDVSVAGKGKGIVKGETRSGLFYEIMRLLQEKGDNGKPLPQIIVAENVEAVRHSLPLIEAEYNKVGYRMYYEKYNSMHHGLAQSRERYFIVGVHRSIEHHFIFKEEDTSLIPLLSSILEKEEDVPLKLFSSEENAALIVEQAKSRVDITGVHACITPGRVNKRQNGRRAKPAEEPMYTLTTQDLHGVIIVGEDKTVVRKLTPTEAMRLQGFPEDYKQVVSPTQIYIQMGNAVSVPVAKFVAEQIKDFLGGLSK